jgi:hypothetical protein
MRNAYKILSGKLLEMWPIGRPRIRWEELDGTGPGLCLLVALVLVVLKVWNCAAGELDS